jgi:NAD+ diphosphatase
MPIAFITPPHDRQSQTRLNPARLLELRRQSNARFLKIYQDSVLFDGDHLDVSAAHEAVPAVFLGLEADTPWFALTTSERPGLLPLRELMLKGSLPASQLTLIAQAKAVLGWHQKHGFCSNCGSATAMQDGGYRRSCAHCGTDHFPRTDPVVIMAVTSDREMLLGRQSSWPPGMYSALAGFMEPGETLEQAVAREVKEETAVEVDDVRYVASQPWPFPSSIMLGAIARAKAKDLVIDKTELETARWFTTSDIELMLKREHPDNLYAANPYAIAHLLIRHALQECLAS